MAVINAEIASCSNADISEIIYKIIVEKEVDKKVIRNKIIKSDFNTMYKSDMAVMDIYTELAHTHDISVDTIRYILRGM